MTDEEITKLMAKKLPAAQKEVDVSRRVLELLESLWNSSDKKEFDLYNKALLQPQVRRYNKACATLVFWQEPEQVERWANGPRNNFGLD